MGEGSGRDPRRGTPVKTWHLEALVVGAVLTIAWMIDQVMRGVFDPWSMLALAMVHVSMRQASVADRLKERSPTTRPDLLHCWREARWYGWEAHVLGAMLAAKDGAVLPVVAFAVRLAYPYWRQFYRRKKPLVVWL